METPSTKRTLGSSTRALQPPFLRLTIACVKSDLTPTEPTRRLFLSRLNLGMGSSEIAFGAIGFFHTHDPAFRSLSVWIVVAGALLAFVAAVALWRERALGASSLDAKRVRPPRSGDLRS